jgi:hypothetical protein
MCYEYYERLQRLEDKRRQGLLGQQKRQAEKDLERTRLDQTGWTAPEEPVRAREKVPA